MATFEESEHRDRLARVRTAMEAAWIEVLVVTDEPSIYYVTGYEGRSAYVTQCAVVTLDADPRLVVRAMDVACARHTAWMDDTCLHDLPEPFIGFADRSGWRHIAKLIEAWGLGRRRIGLEGDSIDQFEQLSAGLPNATLVEAPLLVHRVRGVKSDREIELMRTAGRIADRAMQVAIDTIASGVRECDVAAAIMAAGCTGLPDAGGTEALAPAMPSGAGTDSPHLRWTDRPYAPGTPVNIELGGSRHRYVIGLSRTIHVGPPPDRLRALHAATLEGMERVFEFVRPGVTCEQVEATFRATTMKHGVVKPSRCGYSIGIDWLEPWASFHPGDTTVLEPNMTFHLMLGMWRQWDWGLVLSEAFRVTSTGAERFSSLSRELFVKD